MSLSDNMQKALGDQFALEVTSSYLYLSMSRFLNEADLLGAGHWMRMQAQEELMHAMKLYDYVEDRGGSPALPAIASPQTEWESPLDLFKAALAHEKKITAAMNDLMDLALSERDHATASLLQWFVDEQVEEEATLRDIIPKLRLVGTDGGGLLMIDADLGTRPAPSIAPK
jgi:ferritin